MSKLRPFLYISALLLILIPTSIVLIADVSFNSLFSYIVISISLILVMMGKTITVFEKRKEGKKTSTDMGAIIGLTIVLLIVIFDN